MCHIHAIMSLSTKNKLSHRASVAILVYHVYLSKMVLITLKNKMACKIYFLEPYICCSASAIYILVAQQILFYLCNL